jgi:hypothetical protein
VTAATDEPVIGYSTLQWAWGGLFRHRVCLVRRTERGTPGDTLCGRERFTSDPHRPGWSVGGGVTDAQASACPGCLAALTATPLPVSGIFRSLFETAAP